MGTGVVVDVPNAFVGVVVFFAAWYPPEIEGAVPRLQSTCGASKRDGSL